jgi:DNA excision repair protein ERCC-5
MVHRHVPSHSRLETLAKKLLATDVSIYMYQVPFFAMTRDLYLLRFLKAVRDKQGQAHRNSHIVGFSRRIYKLLSFGVKPVFVLDGSAPALNRREDRKADASNTAGKMLALQMVRAENASFRRAFFW